MADGRQSRCVVTERERQRERGGGRERETETVVFMVGKMSITERDSKCIKTQ